MRIIKITLRNDHLNQEIHNGKECPVIKSRMLVRVSGKHNLPGYGKVSISQFHIDKQPVTIKEKQ